MELSDDNPKSKWSDEKDEGVDVQKEKEKHGPSKKGSKWVAHGDKVAYKSDQYAKKKQSKQTLASSNYQYPVDDRGEETQRKDDYETDTRSNAREKQREQKKLPSMPEEKLKNKDRMPSITSRANKPLQSKNVSGHVKQQPKVLSSSQKAYDGGYKDISMNEKPSASVTKGRRMRENRGAESKEILSNIIACISLMEEKLSKYEDDGGTDSSNKIKVENFSQNTSGKAKPNEKGKSKDKKSKEKKKVTNEKNSLTQSSGEGKDENKRSEQKKREKKNTSSGNYFRATHFLTFRVYNTDIQDKAATIQEDVLNTNKDLKTAFVEVPHMHVTLAVMSVKNNEIEKVYKALDASMNRLNDIYSKPTCKFIEFDSLDSFDDGKVVYMAVKDTEGLVFLQSIVSVLRDCLLQENIPLERDTFTPHATVMKIGNRFSLRKKGIKKIPSDLYAAYKNDCFGAEEIVEVLLCSMAGKKDGEFYKVFASIDLPRNNLTVFDKGMLLVDEDGVEELDKIINKVLHDIIEKIEVVDNVVCT